MQLNTLMFLLSIRQVASLVTLRTIPHIIIHDCAAISRTAELLLAQVVLK